MLMAISTSGNATDAAILRESDHRHRSVSMEMIAQMLRILIDYWYITVPLFIVVFFYLAGQLRSEEN